MGLTATTPQQLADLLRTDAVLAGYGYGGNVVVNLTPVRERIGATAGWTGAGASRPQLFFSTLLNRDNLIDRRSLSAGYTATYAQGIGGTGHLFFSWSLLCTDRRSSSSGCRPVASAQFRHDFGAAPRILPRGHGRIRGTVFRDDEKRGAFTKGMPTIQGVEVVLDLARHTRTDAAGRFEFGDVPNGRHRIEVRYAGDRPFFFTTVSPADVETGDTVDFGIGVRQSSLRGIVRNDVGAGLRGVVVLLIDDTRVLEAKTTDDGTFIIEGLSAGTYEVGIDPSSLPGGFPLDPVGPERVSALVDAPGRVEFVLRPYRTVAGSVRLFNRTTGAYLPLAGATVQIDELNRRTLTDANGAYMFRDLPAGYFAVSVSHEHQVGLTHITVGDGPTFLRNVDVSVVPAYPDPARPASGSDPLNR